MARLHNFSAGPGALPESVVKQAQEAMWELEGCGQGLMETSHRSEAFGNVIDRARERLHRLLGLAEDQEVLFLHGGARTQFFMIPQNLLRGGKATYLDTGTWAFQAAEEARRFGEISVPWSSKADGWRSVPSQGEWGPLAPGTRYLHYTSNNTVAGTEYHYTPDAGDAWLVCDASSDILSRPVDGSKFDLMYAGAQKNLGPSGVTLAVIRRSLLDACEPELPAMCRYPLHAKKKSMYNTPTTFAIYVVERVAAWIEEQGGVAAVDARNESQCRKVYGQIDGTDFWKGLADVGSRSRMNVTFSTGDADLDARFVSESTAQGLLGLKGHSSVGGLRASLYNAQRDASVDALVDFMGHFERSHG